MKCNALLLLLLVPCLAWAGNDGEQVEKKINREFAVTTNGRLSIDNIYGDVDIAIGESNKIKIEVTMIAKAGSTKKAQEVLDRLNVEFTEGLNRLEAKTVIESPSGWTNWFSWGSTEMEINYQMLVPADIFMDLRNQYGDIYLERTDRDLSVDIGYGDIRLGEVNAKLTLDMAYSDGSVSQIQHGELDLSYSDLELESSQTLQIEMKYTDVIIGSATRLNLVSSYGDFQGDAVDEVSYAGKYDDIEFDRVKSIDAESSYSEINIYSLDKSGNFDLRYGEISVENIGQNFTSININTSYAGARLAFARGTSFTVDAETSYCDIQHDELRVSEKIDKTTSTSLKASRGTGGGQLYARMNYGELIIE